jgi:hypothetical protein
MSPPRSGSKSKLCLLSASCWFLAWLTLRPWRWRRHVPSKRGSIFNELQGAISQKTIPNHHWENRSRDSVWLQAGRPRGRSSSPGRVKNFLFSMSSTPSLGSTQPPIQWVLWALSPPRRGVKLITHLPLVPRSRKCGSIHPLPHTPSWRSA